MNPLDGQTDSQYQASTIAFLLDASPQIAKTSYEEWLLSVLPTVDEGAALRRVMLMSLSSQ
jgi:hypothetical protein